MFKISSTGWLCYRKAAGDKWYPLFELTPAQLQEWTEFTKAQTR